MWQQRVMGKKYCRCCEGSLARDEQRKPGGSHLPQDVSVPRKEIARVPFEFAPLGFVATGSDIC